MLSPGMNPSETILSLKKYEKRVFRTQDKQVTPRPHISSRKLREGPSFEGSNIQQEVTRQVLILAGLLAGHVTWQSLPLPGYWFLHDIVSTSPTVSKQKDLAQTGRQKHKVFPHLLQ